MKKVISLLLLSLLGWSGQIVSKEQLITKEHILSNGLKVVVREDHRAPVVVAQVWYKVGSAREHRPITGISHALEHMMFQGTPTLPGEGFSALISQYGGYSNAFTNEDVTTYYEELDASNLEISFKAEADRMVNLSLEESAYVKEIQVVIEERRLRTDDNPQSLTWERFMAVANPAGPYHHPVIGWQDDLDHLKIEDLREWYQKWYAPNNAVVVVVGDVKADEVMVLVEKYFGAIPSRTLPEIRAQEDLVPLGEKRIKVQVKAQLPYMIWGFDVPSLKTAEDEKESYALTLIDALLDGGDSSRLHRDLIRGAQVAADMGASYDRLKQYSTQFMIVGVPAQDKSVDELENKFMAQIALLKTEPVSAQELQRAKNYLLAQYVFDKDSMAQQAIALGELEGVGLAWELADQFPDKIKAVTAEQIQQVAQKYFRPERLTVAELIPQKM